MTVAEHIIQILAEYNQAGNDLLWIWYIDPRDKVNNRLLKLDDELLTKRINTDYYPCFPSNLDIYIFTRDYIFIVCQYDGVFELQPVPNTMMIASEMSEYPCYGG